MYICYNGNVMSAKTYTVTGRIKRPHDIVLQNVEQKRSCHIIHTLKDLLLGTKAKKAGLKTSKMLAFKKVLEIHLGTTEQVAIKTVIKESGENGVRLYSKGTILFANSVSEEGANSTLTILSALHTIQNSVLKLAMEERYAKVVIELQPIMDIIKRRYA